MPQTYFIDGYNVVHFCSRLKALAGSNFEAARDTLIERVARFCGDTGKRAKVVFDGRGLRQDWSCPFDGVHGLQVVFSPAGQTADALIERMVYEASRRGDLVIVSGDRGLRELCRGMGAFTLQPDNFLATIEEALSQSRSNLSAFHQSPQRARLEDHLDPETLQRMEDLKKRLGK